MAEKSSFFNATLQGEAYDRTYKAEDFANYFSTFIGNGVFANPSNSLQVVANNGMSVIVKSGKAWINGYMYENTDNLTLSINTAHGTLKRIDRVVLRLDFINREIKAYILEGTPSSNPVAPTITRDSDKYEIVLADILINNGATSIVQANITDKRQDTSLCGIVKGTVDEIDTTNLFAQYQSSFEEWFNHVKEQLSTDQAGNLQNQIDSLDTRVDDYEDFKANGGTIGGELECKGINATTSTTGTEKIKLTRTIDNSDYTAYMRIGGGGQAIFGLTSPDDDNFALLLERNSDGRKIIRPFFDNSHELGVSSYRWKDIWLSSYSINTNGYTKLPNGLILQWGVFVTSGINANADLTSTVTLPISFPTKILMIIPIIQKCLNASGTTVNVEIAIKQALAYTSSTFGIKLNAKAYVEGGVQIGYITIGC